jgi:hypothetical protein
VDGLQPLHPLETELQHLSEDAPASERMELLWRYYEAATGDRIHRPPDDSDRQKVHEWVKSERRQFYGPMFMTKRIRLRMDAASSMLEKAAGVVILDCPACIP